jgi:peptidyl-tRNA hydrolase
MAQPLCKNNWVASDKVNHSLTFQLNNPTPEYLNKRHKITCLHKDLYENAHSSFTHNPSKLKILQNAH